jgi:hypothetical protein
VTDKFLYMMLNPENLQNLSAIMRGNQKPVKSEAKKIMAHQTMNRHPAVALARPTGPNIKLNLNPPNLQGVQAPKTPQKDSEITKSENNQPTKDIYSSPRFPPFYHPFHRPYGAHPSYPHPGSHPSQAHAYSQMHSQAQAHAQANSQGKPYPMGIDPQLFSFNSFMANK